MATYNKNKRNAVRMIARDIGYSESSIYKILSNPFSFSPATVETVRRAAAAYGIGLGEEGEPSAAERVPRELSDAGAHPTSELPILRIAVIIPARPLYFWREAMLGIEKSKARLEEEQRVSIRLRYVYHNFPAAEAENRRILEDAMAEDPDGLILFPVGGTLFSDFLDEADARALPTVIFNDTQDYMTDEWFRAHPHIGSVGPDCYEEGRSAAGLSVTGCGEIRRLAVICTRHQHSAQASETRVRGMCDGVREAFPDVAITHVELDPTERLAPSTLARHLYACYAEGAVDCLYISNGVTHIASAAIEKLERRLGTALSTCVIGHECSAADRRYLLEGRQRGYIKQDVYTQGMVAVRQVVLSCLLGAPAERCLFRSSVFIR